MSAVLVLALGTLLTACSSDTTTGDKNQTITIATNTTYPPFEMGDIHGNSIGFDIDLITAIAAQEHLKITVKSMQFSGIIPELQGGLAQAAVAAILMTSERGQVVNFSDAYYRAGLTFIAKKGKITPITSEQQVPQLVKGKTIGILKGSVSVNYLNKLSGIKKILQFDNIDDAYNVLQAGGLDMVFFDAPGNLNYLQTSPAGSKDIIVSPLLDGKFYGIAVSKKADPTLLQKINDGLTALQKNGTYASLYKKYFGKDTAGMVTTTVSAATAIADASD